MAIDKLATMKYQGVRKLIDDGILSNVDLKKDLLTTPVDLFRQFVKQKSIEEVDGYFAMNGLNVPITSEWLNNSNFSNHLLKIIKEMPKQLDTDLRLQNIQSNYLHGKGLYFEQFDLTLSNLSDPEFEEVYENFKEKMKKGNPSALSFISKSSINKTITYTATTKIIKDVDELQSLLISYEDKGGGQPSFTSIKNASKKSKSNPTWDFIAKSMFESVEKIGANLAINSKFGFNTGLKSTFYTKDELTNEDIEKEEEILDLLKLSKEVNSFDNNTKRGSMSPNSTENYIDDKNINEDTVKNDKQAKTLLESLLEQKETLQKERLELSNSGDNKKANEVAGRIFEVTNKIKKIEKENESSTSSVAVIEEIVDVKSDKKTEPIKEVTDEEKLTAKINSTKTTSTNILSGEVIDNQLDELKSKEMGFIKVAFLKKADEAESVAKEMLSFFKENFEKGGGVQENIDKVNQKFRDNALAFEYFNGLLKYELKASIFKDSVINKLNGDVSKIIEQSNNTKNHYEEKLSTLSSSLKNLEDENLNIQNKYDDLAKQFDEYEEATIPKLEEYKKQLEDYEQIKANDSAKDELLLAFEEQNTKLKDENEKLKSHVSLLEEKTSNYQDLKDLNVSQKSIITNLKEDNIQLRKDFDLSNSSVLKLETALKQVQAMNKALEEKVKELDEKLAIAHELKSNLQEQKKMLKTVEEKEAKTERLDKKIEAIKPIDKAELNNKIAGQKFDSTAWHRLNFVNLGMLSFEKMKTSATEEVYQKMKSTVEELVEAEMAYKNPQGLYILKENAKNILFNNPDAQINDIKPLFDELQKNDKEDFEKGSKSFVGANNTANTTFKKPMVKKLNQH